MIRAKPGVQRLQVSNSNNPGSRIQTPQVIRVACHNGISPLPGKNHHRSVDNIRGVSSGAEFSTGTGQLIVQRNDLDFLAPQEPR